MFSACGAIEASRLVGRDSGHVGNNVFAARVNNGVGVAPSLSCFAGGMGGFVTDGWIV